MPRGVPFLSAFNGGEWSPELHGRVDLDRYARSCAELLNFLPKAQGSVTRRPGTRYVANTKTDGPVRLIPFEYSTLQAYVIEAGQAYFRFYRNGARLEVDGVPVEIATPYGFNDLDALQWAQSADTLYLAHPKYPPQKLTRTSATSFSIAAISFTGAPSEWVSENYPGTVTFWQGRLWWAGTPNQPQTIWGSKTGSFEDLTLGTAADSAVRYTLDADQMNAIVWLKAQKSLVVGTAGTEFVVSGGATGDPVTPSNVLAFPQPTGVGSARVGAVVTGASISFVQRAGRKVQALVYDEATSGLTYTATELSLYAGHLTRAGIREMSWQQEPWRVLWSVMADGTLRGCTIMADQQVLAWHKHQLGGTNVRVESAAVIPAAGYSELWLAVLRSVNGLTVRHVERLTEDFATGGTTTQSDAYFVDAGLTYSGAPALTFGGLGHLEGQTVQVLVNGAVHPDRVVSGGQITLDWLPASVGTAFTVDSTSITVDSTSITVDATVSGAALTVHVGLGYTSRIETLDLNAGAADGASVTRRRTIHSLGVIWFETLGGFVGWRDGVSYSLQEIQYRTPAMAMDAPPALFTGQMVVPVPSRWSQQCNLVIQQTQPLPMTLVGLAPRLQATE